MTAAREQQIKALQQRLAKLQAEQRTAEARARASASKVSRAQNTRRKILVGAFILDGLGLQDVLEVTLDKQRFADWLTRPDDRALFGLASPISTPATALPFGSAVSAAGAAPLAEGGSA